MCALLNINSSTSTNLTAQGAKKITISFQHAGTKYKQSLLLQNHGSLLPKKSLTPFVGSVKTSYYCFFFFFFQVYLITGTQYSHFSINVCECFSSNDLYFTVNSSSVEQNYPCCNKEPRTESTLP